jgi:acetylornithine deacetylase/succinyl-diaminopimelate desuccinylase-like protein
MSLSRITALAADRRVHRAFHWLHLHELQLRQWQLQMIAIPAPSFDETARATWFIDRFHELGLINIHLDKAGNALGLLQGSGVRHSSRPHAMGEPPQISKDTPCVLLSAHLDTVFPPGTDCNPHEDGPRILAPGACDNAAGLTALLAIAAAMQFAELTPACPILFASNVGEEGAGDLRGMRHIFAQPHNIAAAIAIDGNGNATIVDRALGSRRFRITISGPGGHSWVDAALPNPIFALSEVLTAVSHLELPANPRTTLHCGTISGGTSVNSIPESATADLDLRSVSASQLDLCEAELLATIRSVIDAIGTRIAPRQPLALEIARIGDRPAAALAPDSPLMASIHAVDRHLGIATDARIGSTDANWPLSLGIPALSIGAGGTAGGIHTLHEWYDPTGRELALRRILLYLLDTCALTSTL